MTDKRKPRILNIDIETAPNRVYTWGLYNQNVAISQIEEPGYVLCFAAKWYGEKEVIYKSLHHDGKEEMLKELWSLLDEADAILGWNSQSFDVKHIKRELLEAGYLPPTESQHIDLLKVVRKQFKFPSNKLDFISQRLDIGYKLKHYGFELWRDCMAGDAKAWAIMKRYNKRDVQLVEDAYEILKPWITTPTINFAHFNDVRSCPRCGCEDLTLEDKPHRTKVSEFKQYRCDDCGFVARERKADKNATKPELV
jgi:DNA polymerase elongation subunit (family B)